MLLPFTEAISRFEKAHPGMKVKGTYDNAGILLRMITDKGDRPDLFVSPGSREVAVLAEAGLIEASSERTLGSYKVVLIVPRENPAKVGSWADLRKREVKSIATADPDRNSIGYYARQGLTKLGLWNSIKPKLILTEHAVDAYTLVSQKKVQAAFSYLTCPMTSNPEKLSAERVLVVDTLPPDTYEEARVIIATLKGSRNRALAKQFTDYLLRPEVRTMLSEKGLPHEREEGGTPSGTPATAPAPSKTGA